MEFFFLFLLVVGIAIYGSDLAEFLQKKVSFIDNLGVKEKRFFVAVLIYFFSLVVFKVFNLSGILDIENVARQQLSSLVSVGLAYVFHTQDKLKEGFGG